MSVEDRSTKTSLWLYFAVATVVVIVIAAIHWSLQHPYGTSWDEAEYINEVLIDAQRLMHGMLLRLAGRLLVRSVGRPPAYRILALPFLVVFGLHPASARLLSITCFALSAWYVYRATRCFAGEVAGAFAVLVFALSPLVISASMWISTEGPLYLATSAFLYYVFACWTDKSDRLSNSIGLGLAVGLGFLSKASFAVIALPVLAFWFVSARWSKLGIPRLTSQRKAALVAVLVAGPWWILNFRASLAFTKHARSFVENSLGTPSIETWLKWLNTVFRSLLGVELSVLIILVVIVAVAIRFIRKASLLDPLERLALGVCVCAGLPIVIVQLSGTNDLLRHISPAVIPLAIVVGVLADRAGWIRSRSALVVSGILLCAQLATIVVPAFYPNKRPGAAGFVNGQLPWMIMLRRDQWDWKPLQNASDNMGCKIPTISFIGFGPGLSPPQIQYPWVARASVTSGRTLYFPVVNWLWNSGDGPIDWQKVMNSADQSDIVISAPGLIAESGGPEDADNVHDAELASRLSQDERFQKPIQFQVGRFDPVQILAFAKVGLDCKSDAHAPGAP
jgi:hypothetical protein